MGILKKRRALVLSAGGSKGSYAGGIAEYYTQLGINYDILLGSSTGSLMVPLIAAKEISQMKRGYTSISNDDIFSRNPFKITSCQNGVFKYKLNHWEILKNILIHKKATLGDTSKLRYKTIPKFITREIYEKIIDECKIHDKEIAICVTNFTMRRREYKDLHKCSYEDFLDWLWASTSAPPFMSIVEKDNFEYIDGGVMTMVPLKEAILRGADIIDCVVLTEETPTFAIEKTRNLLHFIINLLYMQMDHRMIENSNLSNITNYIERDKEIIINIHYTEKKLTNNALMFDQDTMRKWWIDGYNYARDNKCKSYLVTRNGYELLDNKKGDMNLL